MGGCDFKDTDSLSAVVENKRLRGNRVGIYDWQVFTMNEEPKNLMEGLQLERNRELLREYEALPNNTGAFGAMFIRQKIKNGELAIADNNDVVKMLIAYQALKDSE